MAVVYDTRMKDEPSPVALARRSFLSRISAGAAALGAAIGMDVRPAHAQSADATHDRWQPTRHVEDDWLEAVSAKHRFFFDTSTPATLADALAFANNYFVSSKSGYGIDDRDLAVVMCLRHHSTPFAYSDAMWAKYGGPIAARSEFTDPKTDKAPAVNVHRGALDGLIKHGVRFAVCQSSTHAFASRIAQDMGGKADEIYKERRRASYRTRAWSRPASSP